MRKLGILLAAVIILSSVISSPAPIIAQAPDFDITGGHFYTQANGQGGAGGTGFRITDEDQVPLWTQFRALGGVTGVGYPSSQRFMYKGFLNQGTQKYVIQHQPGLGFFFLNVFDELSAAGHDENLLAVRSIPKPEAFNEQGKNFAQVTAERLALLDAAPAIKAVFMASADPVRTHGLPTSRVVDVGPALVVRNQRDAMQLWKVDMPFARAGQVTIVNGGDIFKELGMIPGNAATPENPPGATPSPAPTPTTPPATPTTPPATPTPTAPPAPQFEYNPAGVTWLPNCGLTEIRVFVREPNGTPVNNVKVFVSSAGPWNTVSVPTGQEARDPGWTNIVLRQEPVAEPWRVWIIDDASRQLSPVVDVRTDTLSCEPSGTGHQMATITFVKGGQSAPVAGAQPPATAAPQPAPQPVPVAGAFPFVPGGVSWEPNCGMSQVKVKVVDQAGNPKDGMLAHIESGDGTWQATSRKTGSEGYNEGWTDFFLREEPVSETWRVWVVGSNGERFSNTVFVVTDTGPCLPSEEGHQVATLHFQQVGAVVEAAPSFGINSTGVAWAASCVQTQLNIRLRDRGGNPVNGIRFRVETDGQTWRNDSLPTGGADQGPGWTNIWLRGEPFAVRLNVFAISDDDNQISNTAMVDTEDVNCGTTGHQIATVDFVRN